MHDMFRKIARRISDWTGTVWAFAIAISIILTWAITGPIFSFSDTWQLIINTGTTIVTFLMVFLIQNTQNRDNTAIHAKLDELIVHTTGAHNHLAMAEDFTDDELSELKHHFEDVAKGGGTHDPEDAPSDSAARALKRRRSAGHANGRKPAPRSARKAAARTKK